MKERVLSVPNLFSFSRLPLAFLVVWLLGTQLGLFLLMVGILTDGIDGYVARATGRTSKMGAIIDPVFDRLFVLIIFLSAYELYDFPAYSLLFFLRDVISSVASLFHWFGLYTLPIEFKARMSGKIITCIQFATLIIVFFGDVNLLGIAIFWLNISFVVWVIDTIVVLHKSSMQNCGRGM
ncbi:hypothetical protein COU78_05825 [Candidatus Peregrinibacteria bacterium CG10_big_fil_rev_8_21_14_0_10_49_24]|nr:MAG: hypothetical protein COV83_04530 [Candidatus Peregrinibacteria bacterium CG11_big_fil_rev_8_21_14_0_20_49_14]PIR50539.1 MAG: hypothetical protein COU78_05825 [Candidatus Peregrinibacteria bacterium CG10_big_fil_rev_8_21_14_0_10_49_24]PJA67908.1 MAG: hypothetical protein CO157_01990 [Candidatus Peregrinibacteria bacterium CG_4_9_14_3_um_filter_49_12]